MDALAVAALALGVAVAVASFVWARHRVGRLGRDLAASEEISRGSRAMEREHAVARLILSSMEDGVLLIGADDSVRFANPAASGLLGVTPASLGGLRLPAVLRAAELARERAGSTSVDVEIGSPGRWIRCTAVAVGDGESLLLVLRDVTRERHTDAVRRDFVTNASHELKTPVASIHATAETIRRAAEDDPAEVTRFAERLEREATRLANIVSDLLDLSRLEAATGAAEGVLLDGVVREEIERHRAEADRAGVELSVDVSSGLQVRGSGRDLALVVRNLVDNAIRHTPAGGRIAVTLRAGDGDAVLEVADTGVGIPSRDLARIFERFYRVDRARSRETGGTGLGLSIVRHVVENHGGSVEATSELGRGSTFRVRLPIGDGPAADGRPGADQAPG